MIRLDRFPFFAAWLVAQLMREVVLGEDEETEASEVGTEFACDETERWRYRHWGRRRYFCGRAGGSRYGNGALVSELYRRLACPGGLAAAMSCGYGGDGIDRGVLDCVVSDSRGAGDRGPSGQCATRASGSGP